MKHNQWAETPRLIVYCGQTDQNMFWFIVATKDEKSKTGAYCSGFAEYQGKEWRSVHGKQDALLALGKADKEGLWTFQQAETMISSDGITLEAKWAASIGDVRSFLNLPPKSAVVIQVEDDTTPSSAKFCNECGAGLKGGKFCSECGTKL